MRIYTDEITNRILTEYRASGLSQRGYAAQSGIKETTLSYLLYRRGRRREEKSSSARFVALEAKSDARAEYRIRIGDLELLSSQRPSADYIAELSRALG